MTIVRVRWPVMLMFFIVCAQSPTMRPGDAGTLAAAQGAQGAKSVDNTQAYEDEFEKGRQLLQRHEYFEALKVFKRANERAGGQSAECFLAMAQAMHGMKVYANALDASQTAIGLARGDNRLLARAHKLRAEVLQALAETDPARLREAESELRAALKVDPDSKVADLHFNLGVVLMRQGRDAEGVAELQRELEIRPRGSTADEARALVANPRRARERYAPEFSFVSAGGETISLDTLRGRVVLLDFWGTWCAPCARALPSLRKLQKDRAKDAFVIVGISSDKDEKAWRDFMAKNDMVWPQYLDRDHVMQRIFDVSAFPTYVLIDAEGIERFRTAGTGFDRAKALSQAIEKELKR